MSAKKTITRLPAQKEHHVTVLLGEPELRAIQWFRTHGCNRKQPLGDFLQGMTYIAVSFALSHPKDFRAWWESALRYQEYEGVNVASYMSAAVEKHPTYKGSRLPA